MFTALIDAIRLLLYLYIFAIFIYSLLSYFPNLRRSKFNDLLTRICEPLLNAFRFATVGTISFAPMLATFFLFFLLKIIDWLY